MTKADLVISETKIDDMIYHLRHIKNDLANLEDEARAAQYESRGDMPLGVERLVIPAMSTVQHIDRAITNLETSKQYIEEIKSAISG